MQPREAPPPAAPADDPALATIRQAIAAAPRNAALHAEHVDLLGRLGLTEEAVAAARAAVAATPREAQAHVLLGEALLRARRRAAALQAFGRALTLDATHEAALFGYLAAEPPGEDGKAPGPFLEEAIARLAAAAAPPGRWLALIDALQAAGRAPAARAVAGQAALLHPGDAGLRRRQGALLLAAGQPEAAAEAFRAAADAEPGSAEAWLGLTDALWRLRRVPEGLAAAAEAVAAHPAHAGLASRHASFLLAANDPLATEREARRALALEAGDESAWLSLADALWRQQRHKDALRAVEEAAVALPASMAVAARLGHVLVSLDKPVQAAEAFRRAVAAPRAPGHVWLGFTEALWRAGRLAEAEEAARQGVAAHPGHAELRARLAQLHLARGDEASARGALAEALAAQPDSEELRLAMADALWRQGRRGEAVAAAREVVAALPGSLTAASRLGHLLLEVGEAEEAAAIFLRVTAGAPDLVSGWVGLCDAERACRRIRPAIEAFRRAQAAGADRQTLRMLRFRLYGELEE